MASRNALEYGAIAEANWVANLSDMSSFKPKFTFYSDFSIAEFYQVRAGMKDSIKETYGRVIDSWKGDYKALVEIILVLNHKIWAFYQNVDSQYLGADKETAMELSKLYDELWRKADALFFSLYEGNEEANEYYFDVLD